MIIKVAGTSGSGKSTIVRNIINEYLVEGWLRDWYQVKWYDEGRKKPVGYELQHPLDADRRLFVPGHYESPCGGCDTIPNYAKLLSLIDTHHDEEGPIFCDVVFEGLLISADVKRTLSIHEDISKSLYVVAIEIDINECIENINNRRRARMGEKYTPINPTNTIIKQKNVEKSLERLSEAGVDCRWLPRDEVFPWLKIQLGLA